MYDIPKTRHGLMILLNRIEKLFKSGVFPKDIIMYAYTQAIEGYIVNKFPINTLNDQRTYIAYQDTVNQWSAFLIEKQKEFGIEYPYQAFSALEMAIYNAPKLPNWVFELIDLLPLYEDKLETMRQYIDRFLSDDHDR
jgi:hypothetical protein